MEGFYILISYILINSLIAFEASSVLSTDFEILQISRSQFL